MRILFLGGTKFVGRHMAEAALRGGHEITLFHRGTTGVDAFPGSDKILGDRTKNLDLLKGRTWDAVIDSSGYEPATVAASAEALKGSVGRYAFVSTISVYPPKVEPHREDSEVMEAPEGMPLTGITPESYGPLKVLCEREVQRVFGDASVVVRPGLVVGPGDHTDRFTYWPMRMRAGADVLIPDHLELEWQWIDARDLGEFTVKLVEYGATGVYNGVGPAKKATMAEVLETVRKTANGGARTVLVSEEFLKEQGIEQWSDLPFVLWRSEGPNPMIANIDRSLARGMRLRPMEETVRDLVAWKEARPNPQELVTGMSLERQAQILEIWRARTG